MKELAVRSTAIPGLLVVDLPVHGDARGWFRENWQRAKMVAAGLPDFAPVQHSLAFNEKVGVTRGIHAEPWDKFVSVATGRAFGAWVDLRQGPSFGAVHTQVLDESTAVFVPRGVGNSYQTLTEGVVYSYLVNAHWSPEAAYTHLNLADETAGIHWPVPLAQAEISDKDRSHPRLGQLDPFAPPGVVVLGAGGQVGRALLARMPHARGVDRPQIDLADPACLEAFDFGGVDVVINAAGYTAVDQAETPQGRQQAWKVNGVGLSTLARVARERRFTLVHYSTDYVFDGTGGSGPGRSWTVSDAVAPLSSYGQSKAAGEVAVTSVAGHYLIRTSWVVGEGHNFVRTMAGLAAKGVSPRVVGDQVGRLTFATDLAAATEHLVTSRAPFGTYHATNSGQPTSWADIARRVFAACGRDPDDVTEVTSEQYAAGVQGPFAPRPAYSTLDLSALEATGFTMPDQWDSLERYLAG